MGVTTTAGLIFGPGEAGTWDESRVSGPQVRREADGIWRMWYYGRDLSFDRSIPLPTGRLGLAESPDGISWLRVRGPLSSGAVLEPHSDSSRFDSSHVGVSQVTREEGLLWMWYFGGDETLSRYGNFEVKGLQLRVGCAVSRDGAQWLRIEGPHRGAILDVGAPGTFDSATVGWPQVLRVEEGLWRMYYHSLDPARMVFVVGAAESTDGFVWKRRGEILGPGDPGRFDEGGVGTRHVIRDNGRWLMFYEGVRRDGYRSIGLAESFDGLGWARCPGGEPGGAVFAHAPEGSGAWDAFAVGTPCVVPAGDGSFRMYYVGANETAGGFADELGKCHQIGLAMSAGSELTQWSRYEGPGM